MQFAQNCGETFDWYTSMYGIEGLKDLHVAYMPEGGKKFKASGSPELNGGKFWYGTAQFPEPRSEGRFS